MNNTIKYGGLVLDPSDNVATLLFDYAAGDAIRLKGIDGDVLAAESVESGHKMAVSVIGRGSDIIKYGQRIGIATADIRLGEWVHLHNMESVYDTDFRKRVKL